MTTPLSRSRGLRKSFGTLETIDPASTSTSTEGSFVSLIGPSGCGKSTLLRVVAGLEPATAGDGPVVRRQPAIAPGATSRWQWCRSTRACCRGEPSSQRPAAARGQRQGQRPDHHDPDRAAAATSGSARSSTPVPTSCPAACSSESRWSARLALGAPLLAMDEPLAALDEITRSEMRGLLNQLVEGRGVTTLFVTHSISEAVALSDRVLVSSPRPARIVADIAIDLPRPRRDDLDDDPRSSNCAHKCGTRCCTERTDEPRPHATSRRSSAWWCSSARGRRWFASSTSARSCWPGRADIVRYLAEFPDDYFRAGADHDAARHVRASRSRVVVALVSRRGDGRVEVRRARDPTHPDADRGHTVRRLHRVGQDRARAASPTGPSSSSSRSCRCRRSRSLQPTGCAAPTHRAAELLASVDASRWEVLWRLRLPSALPSLFTAAKYNTGLALDRRPTSPRAAPAGSGKIGARASRRQPGRPVVGGDPVDGDRSAPSAWCCSTCCSGPSMGWHVSQRTQRQSERLRCSSMADLDDLRSRIDQLDARTDRDRRRTPRGLSRRSPR